MNCGYSWDEFKYHMRINKKLLPVKLFYFFFFAGVSILLPYMPLYQKQLGMTKVEAGIINALIPFVGSLARPLLAVIADKVNRHKLMLLLCCVLAGILHSLLVLVPYAPVPLAYRDVDVTCLDSSEGSHICKKEMLGIFGVCPTLKGSQALIEADCEVNCTFPVTGEACFKTVPSGSCVDVVTNSTSLVFSVSLVKNDETAVADTTGGGGRGIYTDVAIHRSGNPTNNGTGKKDDYGIRQPKPVDKDKCSEYHLNDIKYASSSYSTMTCTNQTVPLSCKFHCSNMKCRENPDSFHHQFAVTFWSFTGIYMIAQVFYAPCSSLNDAIGYEILGDKRHLWGRQRVWGTIGFGLMALLSGPILDNVLREDGTTNYGISCYLFIGFMVLSAMSAYGLKVPENFHCSKMMKNIGTLLRDPMIISFLFCLFLFGLFFGAIMSFLFWYLLELEHAEYQNTHKIVCGLSLLINTLAEIPMLFFSGKIIKKIGEINCLYIAFIAYGIRFLGYAFLMNIWLVLPIELLHGFSFGLMFPAASMYASRIAPPGMSATLQGLVSAVHFGIGWGCGPLIAGPLYQAIGGSYMFLTLAVVSFVSLIVLAVLINCVCKSSSLPDAVYTINKGQPAAHQLEQDTGEYRDDDDNEGPQEYRDDGKVEDRPADVVPDPVPGEETFPTSDEPLVFR
ncbi:major facilitator superfamily domain-containing protein 6-like [Lineus longissimus]|uniref:major facilitator superfamily domain-containing protein 6-like n=1 Tax=Lineus longissimus TaxID=88925 RepID=UPI002B4F5E18